MALTLDGTNGMTGNVSSDTGSPLGLASKQYSDSQPTPRTTDVLTADVNDYSLQSAGLVQVDSTDTWCVTGVAYDARVTPMDRSQRWILNASTTRILLNSEGGESAETNRFTLAEDQVVIPANSAISLVRDPLDNRWLVTGGELKVGKGYACGGYRGTTTVPIYTNVIDRLTYATETTTAMSVVVSVTRGGIGAAGTPTKGFLNGGGITSGFYATADRLTYSTEAIAAVSGANLSLARHYVSGAGNTIKGFFSGGYTGPYYATTDRTTYSTEITTAVPSAYLTVSRATLAAAGNAVKGFFSGGSKGGATRYATADRTTYATETTAAVAGASLTLARTGLSGMGTAFRGYFVNGVSTRADRTTYATETTVAVSALSLAYTIVGQASMGSSSRGFVAGGSPSASSSSSTRAFRISYATEVIVAIPGANLLTARSYTSGVGTGIF